MKKENKIILILVIFSFLIRVLFSIALPLVGWDESIYSNLGYDLTQNNFKYSLENSIWSDRIMSWDSPYSWPNIGFRAPLLPFSLAVLYFLKFDFLVKFLIAIIGTLSIFLIYALGKKLFDEKVGLYSAIFLSLLPLYVLFSTMILTEVYSTFFILLTFISFWEGFEKNKNIHKILFGIFFALAILARYTSLWIAPVFIFYFLVRDKYFKFLKDKNLWYSILAFFVVLLPLFIYGERYYNNPLGAFIHGKIAASYYGGVQSTSFYFQHGLEDFSIIGLIFLLSIGFIIFKKEYKKRQIYMLLAWFLSFLSLAVYMPHKEPRFLIPITPVICLMSGFFVNKIKKYKILFLGLIILALMFSTFFLFIPIFKKQHNDSNSCFLEANKFLGSTEIDSLIITDQVVYTYYYNKKQIIPFPRPWNLTSFKKTIEKTNKKEIYILITDFQKSDSEEDKLIGKDIENNFAKVFECVKKEGSSKVYKHN